MRRAVLAVAALAGLAVATLAGACGRSPTDDLADIHSGTLGLRLVATAAGEGASGRPVGFEVKGPFALRSGGQLPVARLEYTRLLGRQAETTTFTSTGDRAFLTVGGTAYELDREQVAGLAAGQGEGDRGLGEIQVGDWIDDPKTSPGEPVDGVDTTRVAGKVDVSAALHDLALLARQLGAPGGEQLKAPEGDDAKRLQRAVQSSEIEMLFGRQDRLLRRLRMVVDFGATLPDEARRALGPYAGARLEVDLSLSRPNQEVSVEAPANPKPISQLGPRR